MLEKISDLSPESKAIIEKTFSINSKLNIALQNKAGDHVLLNIFNYMFSKTTQKPIDWSKIKLNLQTKQLSDDELYNRGFADFIGGKPQFENSLVINIDNKQQFTLTTCSLYNFFDFYSNNNTNSIELSGSCSLFTNPDGLYEFNNAFTLRLAESCNLDYNSRKITDETSHIWLAPDGALMQDCIAEQLVASTNNKGILTNNTSELKYYQLRDGVEQRDSIYKFNTYEELFAFTTEYIKKLKEKVNNSEMLTDSERMFLQDLSTDLHRLFEQKTKEDYKLFKALFDDDEKLYQAIEEIRTIDCNLLRNSNRATLGDGGYESLMSDHNINTNHIPNN